MRPADKVDRGSGTAHRVRRLVVMTAFDECETYLTRTAPVAYDQVSLGRILSQGVGRYTSVEETLEGRESDVEFLGGLSEREAARSNL